jgi:hypothetical protein
MSATGGTFTTDQPLLQGILSEIEKGVIQLPDFQRGWVWDDNHIQSLLASVSRSYPIGAVMILQTGGDGVRFKPRLVEGVREGASLKPDQLILDGQQRLTSLFLALKFQGPVKTRTEKGQDIERFYFLDMAKCLDPNEDRLDAVLSIPATKKITSDFGRIVELDLSDSTKEYQNKLFPLNLVFDTSGFMLWKQGFREHFNHDPEMSKFLDRFEMEIWLCFQQYKVPVIALLKETPKEAVCQVFEKVNTGGVTLSVFELMTATYAADDFRLREDWESKEKVLNQQDVLTGIDATAFLVSLTLYSTYLRSLQGHGIVTCKRRDVLKLPLSEYKLHEGVVAQGFLMAARFMAREKVYDLRSVPYSTQLIPLAATCAALGSRFENDAVRRKLARWYWCGVFGELYGGTTETRFANDLPEIIRWVEGGEEPRTLRDANFAPIRLLSLQTRQSAAYKGMMALLMQAGSQDFLSGDPIELTTYFDMAVDIHHIFPADYCEKMGFQKARWNSVVNKAPLTARTNRIIGKKAPSDYLREFSEHHNVDPAKLDDILKSHLIQPELLRVDSFDAFLRDRAYKMVGIIQEATGKQVQGLESADVIEAFGGPLVPVDTP